MDGRGRLESRHTARSQVFYSVDAGRQAVYLHRLQGPSEVGLRPKALLDRLDAPELRLFPEAYFRGGRRSRSGDTRTAAEKYLRRRALRRARRQVMQKGYPKQRNNQPRKR